MNGWVVNDLCHLCFEVANISFNEIVMETLTHILIFFKPCAMHHRTILIYPLRVNNPVQRLQLNYRLFNKKNVLQIPQNYSKDINMAPSANDKPQMVPKISACPPKKTYP